MKALVTESPFKLKFVDVEKPEISTPTDVLVKLKAVGICGSDVHIYHGTNPMVVYPRIMGHEMVGVVEQLGDGVTSLNIGDHVMINQVIPCGDCYACLENRQNVCFNLRVRGVHVEGGNREYLVAPAAELFPIPKDLPFSDAVMIEPMSIAYQALARGGVKAGDIVLVLGAGALGQSILRALQLKDVTTIVADIADERLAEAQKIGPTYVINSAQENLIARVKELSGGFGATVAIDAAGILAALDILTQAVCPAGRIVTMGFSKEPSEVAQLNITAKELDVRGSRLQNNKFPAVISDYQAGLIDLTGQVSHVIPFDDALQAFSLIDSRDPAVKKVVLSFD